MISTEGYDIIITCSGCESKCAAGFFTDALVRHRISDSYCIDCEDYHEFSDYEPASITAYMEEIRKCRKLQ